jgi:hypothetical protein
VRVKNLSRNRKNQSKTPAKSRTPETKERNPFSIFKEGPGRPTLRNDYLAGRRDSLTYLLESMWVEIGWNLECAGDAEDIRKAFQVFTPNPGPLAPFIRVTSKPSTTASIRSTRKQLDHAVRELGSANEIHQKQLRSLQDSEPIAFLLSEHFKKQLTGDLVRRRESVRALKIQISNQKGKIRKFHLRQEKGKGSEPQSDKPDLSSLELELTKLEKDCTEDEKVCRGLEERIRMITPERRKVVTEEAKRQKLSLDTLVQDLNKARIKCLELESKLLDQEAYFYRTQLLEFIQEKKYAHTPRNFADAIAGLPYMNCRRSAERCARLKSSVVPSRGYQVFLFIKSVWERRDSRVKLSLVEWFKQEIMRLPRYKIVGRKKRGNDFRAYLAQNWYYLKLALKHWQGLRLHLQMPYAVTQQFLKNSRNPESPADQVLAERERIID